MTCANRKVPVVHCFDVCSADDLNLLQAMQAGSWLLRVVAIHHGLSNTCCSLNSNDLHASNWTCNSGGNRAQRSSLVALSGFTFRASFTLKSSRMSWSQANAVPRKSVVLLNIVPLVRVMRDIRGCRQRMYRAGNMCPLFAYSCARGDCVFPPPVLAHVATHTNMNPEGVGLLHQILTSDAARKALPK